MKQNILFIIIITSFVIGSGCIFNDSNENKENNIKLEIVVANYTNESINGTIILKNIKNNSVLLNETMFLGKLFSEDNGKNYILITTEGDYWISIRFNKNRTYENNIHVYNIPTEYIYGLYDNEIRELHISD